MRRALTDNKEPFSLKISFASLHIDPQRESGHGGSPCVRSSPFHWFIFYLFAIELCFASEWLRIVCIVCVFAKNENLNFINIIAKSAYAVCLINNSVCGLPSECVSNAHCLFAQLIRLCQVLHVVRLFSSSTTLNHTQRCGVC